MKKIMILAILAASAACDSGKPSLAPPTGDLGTGLNTVERKVPKPVSEVMKAAAQTLQSFELRTESEKGDALGGEIVARRATSDKVTVTVKSVDAGTTSVSVRVGPGDRNMAGLIHEKLAGLLGLGESAEGGESRKDLVAADLATCVAAGEKALKSAKMVLVGRFAGEGWTEIRARGEDSAPASFRFRKDGEGRTEVTIAVGISKTAEARERRDLLKSEFDKALGSARSS